jgi:hypothetical protein
VRNDNHAMSRRSNAKADAKLIKLVATCGPADIDDPQPTIAAMMPHED